MQLIILDDELRIANFLAMLGRERGWSVDITTNYRDFQDTLRAKTADAVALDLFLGNSDGVEQLRFLSSIGYRGAIILMSGFDERVLSSAQQVGHSLGLAITASLPKPMRVAQLRAAFDAVEKYIARQDANNNGPIAAAAHADKIQSNDVAQALDADEMQLYLQPIITAQEQNVASWEALIRWHQPDGRVLLPDQFLPAAEQDSAVIDHVLLWVVDTALAHHHRLAASGSAVPIAINVSGANLRSLEFPDRLAARVAAAGASPSALVLEVTESIAIDSTALTADVLTRLRLKGFELAIDDLGTGYSSLARLRQMPFSEIKIDKLFVADMHISQDSHAILHSIVDMAKRMDMRAVAEGVETAEAAQALTKLGIDQLQGFLYSRPLPFDAAVTWLANWDSQRAHSEHWRSRQQAQ